MLEHTIPASYNGFIYVIDGQAKFGSNASLGKAYHTLVMSHDGDRLKVATEDNSVHYVLIAGEPINEPVAQYGPFVMNDENGIMEAMIDYQTYSNGFERARNWASEIGKRRHI
jgi:redox-sensitive bicupin YhaK (pirin superfamily)